MIIITLLLPSSLVLWGVNRSGFEEELIGLALRLWGGDLVVPILDYHHHHIIDIA